MKYGKRCASVAGNCVVPTVVASISANVASAVARSAKLNANRAGAGKIIDGTDTIATGTIATTAMIGIAGTIAADSS